MIANSPIYPILLSGTASFKKTAEKYSKKILLTRLANECDPLTSDQKALSLPSFVVTQALVDLLAEAGGMK
jgi:hypothetical protein